MVHNDARFRPNRSCHWLANDAKQTRINFPLADFGLPFGIRLVEHERAHVRALRVLCLRIASDLLTNTNSDRVSSINQGTTNFSNFLAGSAKLQAVKLGDKLSDFLSLQPHASARLCFTNQRGQYFEIRIRYVESKTDFEVIGILIGNPRKPVGTKPVALSQ